MSYLADLRNWFLQNRRDFPWRQNPSAYEVWISEVMLQQTQAARVVDYYKRWMKRFPSIEVLSHASIDEVLKLWEGLGYYSRARSILEAARDIRTRFNGKIPNDAASLSSIKGLGPYTVGAILAFGFHQKMAAVDANVVRVLTRFFEIKEDISKAKTVEHLRAVALSILPDKEPHIITEALIELGASICKKKPECALCPIKKACMGFQNGRQEEYPVKSQKIQYEALHRDVAVIICEEHCLVRKGKEGIACTGLYEFPYFDTKAEGNSSEWLQSQILQEFGLKTTFQQHLDEEKHSFTRFRVTLYPKLLTANEKRTIPGHEWHHQESLENLTFSSGHRRLLLSLA